MQEPLGTQFVGMVELDLDVCMTLCAFSFPFMNSQCLIIWRTVSDRFVVLSFQSFWITDTSAEYSALMFMSMMA